MWITHVLCCLLLSTLSLLPLSHHQLTFLSLPWSPSSFTHLFHLATSLFPHLIHVYLPCPLFNFSSHHYPLVFFIHFHPTCTHACMHARTQHHSLHQPPSSSVTSSSLPTHPPLSSPSLLFSLILYNQLSLHPFITHSFLSSSPSSFPYTSYPSASMFHSTSFFIPCPHTTLSL